MSRLVLHDVARGLVEAGFTEYVAWSDGTRQTVAAGVRVRVVLEGTTIRARDHAGNVLAEEATSDPLADVGQFLAKAVAPPFRAWGYLAFDLARFRYQYSHFGGPELHLIIPEVTCVLEADGVSYEGDADAVERARVAVAALASAPAGSSDGTATPIRIAAVEAGRTAYEAAVSEALVAIRANKLEKVILARRVVLPGRLDACATLAASAQTQAARRFAFTLGEVVGVGACPEILLVADAKGNVVTNPLAGTQPRGRTEDEDGRLSANLLRDVKEVSEHAMSIRLAFDEIASVCTPDTARVTDFMRVKRYQFTQHLSSRAAGTLSAGRTTWDALRAIFPGVTVTGIAKHEAIALIACLESQARGVYAGAVGWVDHTGAMDWGIAIRSAFDYGAGVTLNAGAGIVRDSSASYEFDESAHKMQTMASRIVLSSSQKGAR